jgi:hypothetical protein
MLWVDGRGGDGGDGVQMSKSKEVTDLSSVQPRGIDICWTARFRDANIVYRVGVEPATYRSTDSWSIGTRYIPSSSAIGVLAESHRFLR